MRMKRYILIFAFMPLLWACNPLKEGYGIDNPEQYSRVYLAAAFNGVRELNLEAPEPVQVKIFANYSGVVPLKSDVAVTVGTDLSLVSEYNANNGTAFKPIPAACFNLDSDSSVIKAGESTAAIPALLEIITAAFEDTDPYLLPVKITGVSNQDITVNAALETLYIGVTCTAGTLYITANPLTDYTISNTENW